MKKNIASSFETSRSNPSIDVSKSQFYARIGKLIALNIAIFSGIFGSSSIAMQHNIKMDGQHLMFAMLSSLVTLPIIAVAEKINNDIHKAISAGDTRELALLLGDTLKNYRYSLIPSSDADLLITSHDTNSTLNTEAAQQLSHFSTNAKGQVHRVLHNLTHPTSRMKELALDIGPSLMATGILGILSSTEMHHEAPMTAAHMGIALTVLFSLQLLSITLSSTHSFAMLSESSTTRETV